jgi:hypothetical protein
MGHGLGDEIEDRRRHVEPGMMQTRRAHPAFEDFQAQILRQTADFDHQAAGKTRTHALLEAFEIARRAVRRHDHLPAGINQSIDRMAEFRLRGLALEELQVVDDQNLDAAQRLLEGQRRLGLERRDKDIHEALGRQIKHLAAVLCARERDGLQ